MSKEHKYEIGQTVYFLGDSALFKKIYEAVIVDFQDDPYEWGDCYVKVLSDYDNYYDEPELLEESMIYPTKMECINKELKEYKELKDMAEGFIAFLIKEQAKEEMKNNE